jgi:hypothetical protein
MIRKTKTFTLIEVLVAMGVFLVGITPLIGVLASLTLDHVEKRNVSLSNDFLKHEIRKIIDAETAEPLGESFNEPSENKRIRYEIEVIKLGEGLQEITIRVGTDPTLDEDHPDHEKFKDFPLKDDRIQAEATFLNTYSVYGS